MKQCANCDTELVGRQAKWCSPECSKENARAVRLKAHFDITVEEYEAILAEQGGVCGVCGREPKPGKRLATDHDHRTTLVRGLLCYVCNRRFISSRTDHVIVQMYQYINDPPAQRVIGRRSAPGRPPAKRKRRRVKPRRTR